MASFRQESNADFSILCGDFNLVQDFNLDCFNYSAINNPRSRHEIIKLKESNNLHDPWRLYNPSVLKYTWLRKNPIKRSRLDFFLFSEELLSSIDKIEIKSGYRTDHSSVELDLIISDFRKGRGFWKFNNSLLKDKDFVENVRNTIFSVIKKYAITVYDPYYLQNTISLSDTHFIIDEQQFFEQILLEIRGLSIPYAIKKKKKNNN